MGKNLYLSPGGSDSGNNLENPATPGNLTLGLAYALTKCSPGGGDTIWLCAATPDGNPHSATVDTGLDLQDAPSGTDWSGAVKVRVYPQHHVTIRPSTSIFPGGQTVLAFSTTASYIDVDGAHEHTGIYGATPRLHLDGILLTTAQDGVVQFNAGHHQRIRGCEIFNGGWVGVSTSQSAGWGHHYEILNNKIHDNGRTGTLEGPSHGIYISGSGSAGIGQDTNHLVEGNEVWNNDEMTNSAGITLYTGTNRTLQGITVRNNYVHDNPQGIGASDSSPGALIYNNIVSATRLANIGIVQAANCRVLFNTLINGAYTGVDIQSGVDTEVRNNIMFGNLIDAIQNTGSGTLASHNLIGVDPLFTDEDVEDFTLQGGSPAIGYGFAIPGIGLDFASFARLDPPSAGAYEFGSVLVDDPYNPEEEDDDPTVPEGPGPDPEEPPGTTEPPDDVSFPVLTNIIDSFDSVRFENKIHAVTQERTSGRVGYHVFNMATKLWEIVNQEVVASNSDGDIGVTICVRSNGEPCIAFRGDREAGGPANYHGMVIATAGDYLRSYVTRLVDDVWTTPAMLGSPNDLTATFFPFGTLYNGAVNVRMGRAIAEQDDWVRFVFTVEEPADVANTPDLYTQLLRPDNTLTLAHEFEFTGGLGYTAACVAGDPCVFQYAGDWYTAVPVGLLIYPSIYIWKGVGTLGDATFEIPLVDPTTSVQTMPDTYTTLNPPIGVRWFKDKLYVVMGARQGSTLEWAALKTISPPFSEVDPDALSAPREEQVGPTWPNSTYARHGVEFATIRGKDYLFKCTTGNFGVPGSTAKSILEKIDLDADVPGDNGYLLAEWLADNG